MTVKLFIMLFLDKLIPLFLVISTLFGMGSNPVTQVVEQDVTSGMTIANVSVTLTDEECNKLLSSEPSFYALKHVYGIEYCKPYFDDYVTVMKSSTYVLFFYYNADGEHQLSRRWLPSASKEQLSNCRSINDVIQIDPDGDYFLYTHNCSDPDLHITSHLTTDGYYIEIHYDANWNVIQVTTVLE